ncbi:sulfatase family protein [Rufibacter radiotolerans]|uniref:sulfatase family protein n=1 Tax=Rufibacter radiotolerans TaxID=1379910 RepID=UPI0006645B8D|nr:sulfatase [Rufibacter radiotolerans]
MVKQRVLVWVCLFTGWVTASCSKQQASQTAAPSQTAQTAAPASRPNIVVFIGDDLGATDIGPYGNKVVQTPNLDKLAKESMLFTRTFAGSPTCGPSRSTLMTGLMPFRHGAHGNHSGVKKGTKSLVQYLQPLGYKVVIAGKYHIGPEDVFAFERISKTNVPEPGFEGKSGLNWDLNMEPVDTWLSQQPKDQPFLLIVADHSPHVIWPEKSRYNPQTIDIPSIHVDTKDTRKSRVRYYEDITKMDGNVGKLLKSLDQHNLAQNTMLVFTADQGPQFPFAKWSLYDYGIQTPMLIRWPGQVKPNTRTGALVSQADLLPTFMEIAGGTAPANIDGQSFLSVLKGQKDTHHEQVFASHTGDRLMNRSPSRMLRTTRYKYILNLAPENVYHTHMDKAKDHDGGREYWDSWVAKAKTDQHAAAVLQRYHQHPKEELYDLQADPKETKNIAADPQHAKLLAGFRTQLAAWRQQQGDQETGPEVIKDEPQQKGQKPVAPYVFLD